MEVYCGEIKKKGNLKRVKGMLSGGQTHRIKGRGGGKQERGSERTEEKRTDIKKGLGTGCLDKTGKPGQGGNKTRTRTKTEHRNQSERDQGLALKKDWHQRKKGLVKKRDDEH